MDGNLASIPKGDILVVDDKPDNLRLLSDLLKEQGYKVRSVMSGQTALKAAQARSPDLILLDINMPQMDGYEVCQHLKAEPQTQDIPVIFISALDEVLDKVKAFSVGGVDYMTKPFQIGEVLARIENQLKLRWAQKVLAKQNALLEQEVRTRQQSEARERERAAQLAKALETLKQTQAQLIQTEKMSGLGQMVAGIAHELNNPVTFIYGNLTHANDYFEDLLELIELYQQVYPTPAPPLQQALEEIGLDFLIEDLRKLLGSMKAGSDRIRAIVEGLLNFSRHDQAEMKAVNLHEGIDNALMILQHRLRQQNTPQIEAIREYAQLPLVNCYPSQINQVFMNLLNNAIDALEVCASLNGEMLAGSEQPANLPTCQPESVSKPTIWICTEARENGTVIIRIADNGPGMSEEVRSRIFDPFFTTKTVGQGTGLGLSISYQIVVEQHHGKLTCDSSPGKGTEFTIEIPMLEELEPPMMKDLDS